MVFWRSATGSSELLNLKMGSWTPKWGKPILIIWSQAWLTRDLMAGIWTEGSLEPSKCRICSNSIYSHQKLKDLLDTQWVFGKSVALGQDTTYLVSGINPESLFPVIWGSRDAPKRGIMKVHIGTRNWSQLSVFSEFLGESGSTSNGL